MRSVLIAYLLWLPFGVLGAHRIYCNRIGTGVLWCFTGGFFLIGWIVDFFLIPSLVREANAEEISFYRGHGPIGPLPPPHPAVTAYQAPHARPMPNQPELLPGVEPGQRVVFCTRCGSSMQVPVDSIGACYACPTCRIVLQVPA